MATARSTSYQKFTKGTVYKFRTITFWAENGCICVTDETNGDFQVVTCKEWAKRAEALNLGGKRANKISIENARRHGMPELRDELFSGVADMFECYYDAKEQGDHDDPAVSAWFQRHRPWKRSHGAMTGAADFSTGAPAETLPRGPFTGKTAKEDRVLQVTGPKRTPKRLLLPSEL